ncbi:MAG TPA: NmrA family NAD(P)-binding protein [Holophagaceae bacterium]|nr:NmrA family NAD(P)-binding protein [Holophagaceae bacterium]
MQVVVAGATGFVGSEVVRQALAAGHEVFALVRVEGEATFSPEDRATGRLTVLPFGADPEVLMAGFGLEPGPKVINAAGLNRERPGADLARAHPGVAREVVALAEATRAVRLIHLAPLDSTGDDAWSRSKAEAEAFIRAAAIPTTILRCAPLFGPGDTLLDEIGAWMMRSPLIPRFLEDVRLDPLAVEDAAEVLLRVEVPEASLGGAPWTWGRLLEACAAAAGKSLVGPRLSPESARAWGTRLGHRAFWSDLVPFTAEGFDRHAKGYAVDPNDAEDLLGRPPVAVEAYLAEGWAYRA